MKIYKVMVTIPLGHGGTYECIYSGINHYNRESAEREVIQAQKDIEVIKAWIVCQERETIRKKVQ